MHKIHFKKMYAQNFLCFGQEGIEINFDNQGEVTLIKGKNLDVASEEDNTSSNGSGKSSILDAFIYGLFGKTVKNPKKIGAKDVINTIVGKKMVVEIYFDDYKIQRLRKPDGLKLWKSAEGKFDETTELTRGEMKQTQSYIESILGFNYETMRSICVFTDNNSDSYLESTAQDRRMIIENLLGLEKYRKFHEKTKEFIKDSKQELINLNFENDKLISNKNTHQNNLSTYKTKKDTFITQTNETIKRYQDDIVICEKEIESLNQNDPDVEKYNNAQIEIETKQNQVDELQTKIDGATKIQEQILEKMKSIATEIQEIKDLINPITVEISILKNDISKNNLVISQITKLSASASCDHCFGQITHENCDKVKVSKEKENEALKSKLEIQKSLHDKHVANAKIKQDDLIKVNEFLTKVKNSSVTFVSNKNKLSLEITELKKIPKPETVITIEKYKNKINLLKANIIEKENELKNKTPFCDLISEAETKLNEINTNLDSIKVNIETKTTESKALEFWLEAFGEKGIRKFIIEQILPILNKTIGDMLNILIDGKLNLIFDNEFNDMITKYPENINFPYDLLSNGQKRRINLALSQAFAYVRQLNVGNYPNVIFLDEVSINMDSQGNNAIYTLIKMLSKDKKVFVTTHDQELQALLSGNSILTVEMHNGVSKLR